MWQNTLLAECERSCRRKESAAGYSGGRSPGVVASTDFAPRWSDHASVLWSLCGDDAEGKRRSWARDARFECASLRV